MLGSDRTTFCAGTIPAVFSVVVALVVLLIIDLDRSQQVLVRVGQTSLTELLEDLDNRR